MSVRLVRLLSIALLGACLATPAIAKTHSRAKAKAKSSAAAKGPTLIWRGDVATANGVIDEVALAWEKAGHGRIELQPFNTASGIDAVSSNTADLAGSARASDGTPQNANLTFTPVAWDALVIITGSSNPVSNLTLKQVHDIYFGKITNWSEVGGRSAPIDVYAVASPGDGVEYSLRRLLFGRGNQPVAAPRLYVNTRKLEEGIALNPNGFGVATLTGIAGNAQVKAIPLNDKAANVANIADGSYPLYTPLYLVTNPASPKAAQVQAFIDFQQSDVAKAALLKHAVLPYQDGIALAALDTPRRNRILAEVGARAGSAAPISAPGATYAARAAVAPTSSDTLAAKLALDRRRDEDAETERLTKVKGSVAAVSVSSVAKAKGSATTVTKPDSNGKTGSANATTSTAGTSTYKVTKGDTLSSIAKRNTIQVSQLREWNNLKNDQLKLGQVLRISNN